MCYSEDDLVRLQHWSTRAAQRHPQRTRASPCMTGLHGRSHHGQYSMMRYLGEQHWVAYKGYLIQCTEGRRGVSDRARTCEDSWVAQGGALVQDQVAPPDLGPVAGCQDAFVHRKGLVQPPPLRFLWHVILRVHNDGWLCDAPRLAMP